MKPKGTDVAAAAVQAAHVGYTYDEMDCQAFVEHCVRQAGGRMDYLGTNDMARRAAWLGTLDEARAQGRLVPGAVQRVHQRTAGVIAPQDQHVRLQQRQPAHQGSRLPRGGKAGNFQIGNKQHRHAVKGLGQIGQIHRGPFHPQHSGKGEAIAEESGQQQRNQ